MANNQSFDPYDTYKKFTDQWENYMNEMIHVWTNNKEFVQFSKMGTNSHTMFLDLFKKNQELLANQLNMPTKNDIANIAKLSLQTEEKLDLLEEQIWDLQDSVQSTNKEIETIVNISSDIIKLTKQLKTELSKTKKEVAETKQLRSELQELKDELSDLQGIKEEIGMLKEVIDGTAHTEIESSKIEESKVKEVEPELIGTNSK